MTQRTNERFPVALAQLLSERALSRRQLARRAGIDPRCLTRAAVGGDAYATAELASAVTRALGLPVDYFVEVRAFVVANALRNPCLRDQIYDWLQDC